MLASRILRSAGAQARSTPLGVSPSLLRCSRRTSTPIRVFTSTPRHRKDASRISAAQAGTPTKTETSESVKPETVEAAKPAQPAKQDPFLAEQTVTNKEQRKADWAIIKDMAHYLWPKDHFGTRFRVGLSVAFLIGAKVRSVCLAPSFVARLLIAVCRSSMYKFHSISRALWIR